MNPTQVYLRCLADAVRQHDLPHVPSSTHKLLHLLGQLPFDQAPETKPSHLALGWLLASRAVEPPEVGRLNRAALCATLAALSASILQTNAVAFTGAPDRAAAAWDFISKHLGFTEDPGAQEWARTFQAEALMMRARF